METWRPVSSNTSLRRACSGDSPAQGVGGGGDGGEDVVDKERRSSTIGMRPEAKAAHEEVIRMANPDAKYVDQMN